MARARGASKKGEGQGQDQARTAADLQHAVEAALPAKLTPQLATLTASAPSSGEWVVETKFDGYRLLARVEGDRVQLFTRNGNDWTAKLRDVAESVRAFDMRSAWLDGEIVVLNEHGLPDFNRLQNAIDNKRSSSIVYFVFDLLHLGQLDLRKVPLASRRALLQELFKTASDGRVRFSDAFDAPPVEVFEAACRLGLEGVMLKRADSAYTGARSPSWLKLKCQLRQEFVVIGFTDRTDAPREIGGLLLGYHDQGKLRYAGSVGTGWNGATGRALRSELAELVVDEPSLEPGTVTPGRWSKRRAGGERWVKPSMVVEVAFSEWTPQGHVRHPTFRGVRTDKPWQQIVREQGSATPAASAAASPRAGGKG